MPFYAQRGWIPVTCPVTLQQKHGPIEWEAEVVDLGCHEKLKGDSPYMCQINRNPKAKKAVVDKRLHTPSGHDSLYSDT